MEPLMNVDGRGYEERELTEAMIACAYTVSNALGCGFLESAFIRVHLRFQQP